MTLKNAIDFFESLQSKTTNKSELKVYQEFIHILTSLKKRNLSDAELQSIEDALDGLDLTSTPKYNRKHYSLALRNFKKYLKDSFSFVSKSHFTNLGIGFGMSFGVVFGIVVLSGFERSTGIALGIAIGMLVGLVIGRRLDDKAAAEGRVL